MILATNIRVPLRRAGESDESAFAALRDEFLKSRSLAPADVKSLSLKKRAIDARKNEVYLVASMEAELDALKEQELIAASLAKAAGAQTSWEELFTTKHVAHANEQIVVVGAGCAGLFCTLALARAGLCPLLIERGDNATRRQALIERHNEEGTLDEESNIQFGLGGAGTFSDGKLSTGTRSPLHELIISEIIHCGGKESIAWDSHPHVGSDMLPLVVTQLQKEIEDAGGKLLFRTKLTDIITKDGVLSSIRVSKDGVEQELSCTRLILAHGHSARDVYEMLSHKQVCLERKPFAMGVRIENLQADVDRKLYGSASGHPLLGAAPYKGACHLDDQRSVFTFCMCPGGRVVSAASEQGGICTNGASLSARNEANANAGLLVNINPEDLETDELLAGIDLQRMLERRAFDSGGGGFVAPAQLVGDFLNRQASSVLGNVQPSYPRSVKLGSLDDVLTPLISDALRSGIPQLAKRLPFLALKDSVLTAVETRSSSPLRIVRNEDFESVSTPGLYPIGEGAGYAGGIMSAATDGLKCALTICEKLSE